MSGGGWRALNRMLAGALGTTPEGAGRHSLGSREPPRCSGKLQFQRLTERHTPVGGQTGAVFPAHLSLHHFSFLGNSFLPAHVPFLASRNFRHSPKQNSPCLPLRMA